MAGLTDEEMAALEAKEGGLTDEQMNALESKPVPVEKSKMERFGDFLKSGVDAAARARDIPLRLATDTANELSPQGQTGALLRGAGKGLSFGFTDELRGAHGAWAEGMNHIAPFAAKSREFPEKGIIDAMKSRYTQERDTARREEDTSASADPASFYGGEVAGAIATPNPFSKLAKVGLAGRLAGGAGMGELYGIGASHGEDAAAVASDMSKGGALGLAAAGAVEPLSAVGRFGSKLMAQGKDAQMAKVAKDAAKDFATERGGLGSDSRGVLTRLKTAEEVVASPIATPEMKAQAQGFIDSEIGKQTRLTAWQNTLDDLPSGLGQMQERRSAMEVAGAAAEPAAVESRAMGDLSQSWIQQEVLPRADRLFQNKILSTIGQFGGAPVTTTKNLLKAPLTQYRAGQALSGIGGAADNVGKLASQPAARTALERLLPPAVGSPEARSNAVREHTQRTGEEPKDKEDLARSYWLDGT